jgi:type IV pilus assembly protein PilA
VIARIHKSMKEKDQGFTLIELLVVMIIIGILAAIAIPVFLNQRKKAVDTAAKSDVSVLGKELAAYYVDSTTAAPAIAIAGTKYTFNAADLGPASKGMTAVGQGFTAAAAGATPTWCVQVTYVGGSVSTIAFGSDSGLGALGTTCSAAGVVA